MEIASTIPRFKLNQEIKKHRLLIWGGAAGVFILLAVIGALAPEDRAVGQAKNAVAWEKQLMDGAQIVNGPSWKPTKADQAMFRASAKVNAERLGAPPSPAD